MKSVTPAVLLVALVGCGGGSAPVERADTPHAPVAVAPIEPELLDAQGLHNLYRVTPWLYSGSQPDGPPAFDELQKLGVKTVVCVDGMPPDAASAKADGIRVIHLPIGYDGVPEDMRAAYARVAKEADGPIYVHCHHGVHRGPAAAAIMLRAHDGVGSAQALAFLSKAGTSPDYEGLWRDVAAFDPTNPGVYTGALPEAAPVPDFAGGMAHVDRIWDNLKMVRKASWKTPEGHPDISPKHESLMLAEAFRELDRLPMPEADAQFRTWLAESVKLTAAFSERMHDPAATAEQIEAAFSATAASCRQCHKVYRD
ncbi:hypothetical protein GC173_02465 [bacterium]|nr:hypothetical protein [bacterium]